jgi:8-oxo-dGTP pyrophosphatase MutT (NUDIX family)
MVDHTDRVAAVVIPRTSDRQEYLVAKRADNGNWEFPGGKEDLEKDENILDTAEREILEELNLDIDAAEYREKHSYTSGGYNIIPVYAEHNCSNPGKHIDLEDHIKYRWITPANLPSDIELGKEVKCLKAFDIL